MKEENNMQAHHYLRDHFIRNNALSRSETPYGPYRGYVTGTSVYDKASGNVTVEDIKILNGISFGQATAVRICKENPNRILIKYTCDSTD
jgi:hypothetical protein